MNRTMLLKLHRIAGLMLALPLIVVGLSGSIIVFEAEIDEWLNPELFHITSPGAPALSVNELITRIEADDSRVEVTYLALERVPSKGWVAYVAPREGAELDFDEVFIDPVSGHINGRRMWGACCFESPNFVPFMYKLHNRLLLPIDAGRFVNGMIATVWVGLMLIGLWLTFPSAGARLRRWIQTVGSLSAETPRRQWLAWHRFTGVWLLPVLMLVAITGVGLGFEDGVRGLVARTLNLSAPPTHRAAGVDADFGPEQALQAARRAVQERGIELDPVYIRLPGGPGHFSIRFGGYNLAGLPQSTVYVSTDGRVAGVEAVAGETSGDFVMAALQPLHAGRIGGLAGRVLVFVAGLALTLLAASGFVMWSLRNFRARR